MTCNVTPRQLQILELLLKKRSGLTIDAIANALDISRTAVLQHFSGLQGEGCVQEGSLDKTAGRPVRCYVITEKGISHFPKQYAWFSEIILNRLKEQMGSDAFREFMGQLGIDVAQGLLQNFAGKSKQQRLGELVTIMQGLGYEAEALEVRENNQLQLQARNCVYHDLAQKHAEICEFDLALMSTLLDGEIEHLECLVKGDEVCRFKCHASE
jgi:predicted ArsR family transcriptional regulator